MITIGHRPVELIYELNWYMNWSFRSYSISNGYYTYVRSCRGVAVETLSRTRQTRFIIYERQTDSCFSWLYSCDCILSYHARQSRLATSPTGLRPAAEGVKKTRCKIWFAFHLAYIPVVAVTTFNPFNSISLINSVYIFSGFSNNN